MSHCLPHAPIARTCHRTITAPRRMPSALQVARDTGPLGFLASHHALVIADCQNINMGGRDLGFDVDWRCIAARLDAATRSASMHAFISQPAGNTRQSDYYERSGWIPHAKVARSVHSSHGPVRKLNTDHLIAFFAGLLASRSRASLVIVASGDGDLVEDIAEALSLLRRPRPLATLSLAGSTNQRLNARQSSFVHENIELGMDCLNRRPAKREGHRFTRTAM